MVCTFSTRDVLCVLPPAPARSAPAAPRSRLPRPPERRRERCPLSPLRRPYCAASRAASRAAMPPWCVRVSSSFPPAVVFPVTSLAILSSTAFPEVVSSLPAWPAFPSAASSFIDPSLPTSPSPLPPAPPRLKLHPGPVRTWFDRSSCASPAGGLRRFSGLKLHPGPVRTWVSPRFCGGPVYTKFYLSKSKHLTHTLVRQLLRRGVVSYSCVPVSVMS